MEESQQELRTKEESKTEALMKNNHSEEKVLAPADLYLPKISTIMGFPDGSVVKKLPAVQESQERQVWSLGWEDSLEEGMAARSSIRAQKIPWTEEPGGLQCMGSQSTRHEWSDWACTHSTISAPDSLVSTYPWFP